MKANHKSALRILLGGAVLIVMAGTISDYIFKDAPTSRHLIAWIQKQSILQRRYGEFRRVEIVRQTDYGNQATGSPERKFVVTIDGSVANGRLIVVDLKPGSGHDYQIARVE